MVGTIVPMVHGGAGKKVAVTAIWTYTLGCVLGAVSLGAGLGVLGKVLFLTVPGMNHLQPAYLGCGIIGLIYSLRETEIFRILAPQICRQVPEQRRRQMSNDRAALCYGIELGFGVVTIIPISSFYLIVIWTLLTNNFLLSFISVVGFGLGKAMPVMFLANSGFFANGRFDLTIVLTSWQRVVHYLNGLILCFVATIFLINWLYRWR